MWGRGTDGNSGEPGRLDVFRRARRFERHPLLNRFEQFTLSHATGSAGGR
jgi:hypothetical protein